MTLPRLFEFDLLHECSFQECPSSWTMKTIYFCEYADLPERTSPLTIRPGLCLPNEVQKWRNVKFLRTEQRDSRYALNA